LIARWNPNHRRRRRCAKKLPPREMCHATDFTSNGGLARQPREGTQECVGSHAVFGK
jgi:hypothetical protein